jgi:hypothetical protein
MFEVEREFFFHCAWQRQQSLIAFGAKFLNYTTLRFCTISMHIMTFKQQTHIFSINFQKWIYFKKNRLFFKKSYFINNKYLLDGTYEIILEV